MNAIEKTSRKIIKSVYSLSTCGKIFLLLSIVLLLIFIYDNKVVRKEGFKQSKQFVIKEGDNVFDDFYVDYYDDLAHDAYKNSFEIKEIIATTKLEPGKISVLDAGCGTGHHCKALSDLGSNVYGIDKSHAMIKKCNKKYNSIDFRQGDIIESITFPPNSFNLINCLYFTVYYIDNKKAFFENCFNWLKPQGYLALHLVNKDKFNPILNVADPLVMVSPQKYAKERITNSTVKFNDMTYKADFKYKKGSNKATFEEVFKDDTNGNVRKNIHQFHMPSQKDILSLAKSAGFIMKGYIDMVACQYEYQYIYILYKP